MREARTLAATKLAERGGHRDRRTGAFGMPEADAAEPDRTERLLRKPFAFRHTRAGDAWQAIEGFLLFRVNGTSRVGTSYRLIVIGVNATFGLLSGLQPLLPPRRPVALVQTSLILALQLAMSLLCYGFLPDADRLISRFAGTQFLLEGLSTSMLLTADLRTHTLATAATNASSTAGMSYGTGTADGLANSSATTVLDHSSSAAATAEALRMVTALQSAAFALSLLALAVPITQLLEQRCVTPTYNLVKNKGGDPFALLAAAYMIAASLPKRLCALLMSAEQGAKNSAQAAESASADAGDDEAVVQEGPQGALPEEGGSGGGESADDADKVERSAAGGGTADGGADGADGARDGGAGDGAADGASANEGDGAEGNSADGGGGSIEFAGDAAMRVSQLLARAVAAKEVAGKNLVSKRPLPLLPQEGPAEPAEEDAAEDAAEDAPLDAGTDGGASCTTAAQFWQPMVATACSSRLLARTLSLRGHVGDDGDDADDDTGADDDIE